MTARSYFPNYYSVEDILVTQDRVPCLVNNRLLKMGFLDSGSETDHLEPGRTVNLPLWYIKELKANNPYLSVQIPDLYKNVHKAICEAETTHIEMGKLNPHFYEYGRYLAPYDRNHNIGRIVYETCRQRVRNLLVISENTGEDAKVEHRLESIENKLYDVGVRTNTLFTEWLQQKSSSIRASELVQEHSKKRKRFTLSDDEMTISPQNNKK